MRNDTSERRTGRGHATIRNESSPTPDMMPGFQKGSRLDKAEHTGAHDMSSVIGGSSKLSKSPAGPHCHLDGPASGRGAKVTSPHLGTGNDSLADAAKSIPSGSKAPKVDWSKLKGR